MKQKINHIYLHYPFCTSRCGYCSFYTEQFSLKKQEDYFETLDEEIIQVSERYKVNPLTIYFGGGTPSLLSPGNIQRIIDNFHYKEDECEISLECNPITLTSDYIGKLAKTQVNRLSLGIQSLNEKILNYLGRKHRPDQVVSIVKKLRQKAFSNISGDLIYGIPQQSIKDIEEDIDHFLDLDLDHISIYCLSLDQDAILYKDKHAIPKDDTVADMYNLICSKLKEAGMDQYEISNFSKKASVSQHNLAYWQQKDYLGLGPGAYGTIGKMRYNNNSLTDWKKDIREKQVFRNKETLSNLDRLNEYIMLQLRLNEGLSVDLVKDKFSYDILTEKKEILNYLLKYALIKQDNKRICLTKKSRFISNYVISEMMEE